MTLANVTDAMGSRKVINETRHMGRGTISHQGGKTRGAASCAVCRMQTVQFEGASCFFCREQLRAMRQQAIERREMNLDRRAMGAVVAIFIAAALLAIGFISAHGTWVRMNP